MSKSRDNHYVPQWYQKGFCVDKNQRLLYIGITPNKLITLPNAEAKSVFTKRWLHPKQCFYQTDLYTTFFGKYVNDEIERELFSEIDEAGSTAVRAFIGDDLRQQHHNFENLYTYLDAQKIRTPKGLDWIRYNYPQLSQLELMVEMQAIRAMHCTLWTEGIREIVSAKESNTKFIVSDHPITIYNYSCPPDSELCVYPGDPDIALKATQTIYALNKDHALILTNLEYAQDPYGCSPLEKRTYSQRVRKSLIKTDALIRTRNLNSEEVTKINYIIKSRAKKYIAAGKEEWLYPEMGPLCDWPQLREVLMPPSDHIHHFGGEVYVGYKDGSTHYQDAFGRSTPGHKYFDKNIDERALGRNELCGCGSGKKYKKCCRDIPKNQRTTWKVRSIRERNLNLFRSIYEILGFDKGNTWVDVRRTICDSQIADIYGIYGALWPIETDVYDMLPKPDSKFRGLYTGIIDPRTIDQFVLGMIPYFDELLIQHPFINPNNVNPDFSPVASPSSYRYQALKEILLMLKLEPYVRAGRINLIPDPCCFDYHLHRQMLDMATNRGGEVTIGKRDEEKSSRLAKESLFHTMIALPDQMKEHQIRESMPEINDDEILQTKKYLEDLAEDDPLALMQELSFESGGQFMVFSMAPNYEMALFIAQATGSVILTDSDTRWKEFHQAQYRENGSIRYPWAQLSAAFRHVGVFITPDAIIDGCSNSQLLSLRKTLGALTALVREDSEDAAGIAALEPRIVEGFEEALSLYDDTKVRRAKIQALMPKGGFVDRHVQRLFMKSNCQIRTNSVPIVMYVEPA